MNPSSLICDQWKCDAMVSDKSPRTNVELDPKSVLRKLCNKVFDLVGVRKSNLENIKRLLSDAIVNLKKYSIAVGPEVNVVSIICFAYPSHEPIGVKNPKVVKTK